MTCRRSLLLYRSRFYRKWAAQNDALAMFKLGWFCIFCLDVEKDGLQCVKYKREAIDEGIGEAMCRATRVCPRVIFLLEW